MRIVSIVSVKGLKGLVAAGNFVDFFLKKNFSPWWKVFYGNQSMALWLPSTTLMTILSAGRIDYITRSDNY